MNHVVPQQHPAVVLRSHYTHLRALLAIAMIAVVGLSAAVVILASNDDTAPRSAATAAPAVTATPAPSQGVRYDGGPEEGTRGIIGTRSSSPGVRYDGGPEEGTRGITSQSDPAPQRLGASRPEPAFR